VRDFQWEFVVIEASRFGNVFDTDSAGGRRSKSDFLNFCLLFCTQEGGLFFVVRFVGVFFCVAVGDDFFVDENVSEVNVGDQSAVDVYLLLGGVIV